jgi:hypothetical protein
MQALAYGLNDSPVGLAAWMVEKFRAWSDCNGEIETRFSKDELLTQIMIYWVTQTINSSIRSYYKDLAMPQPLSPGQHIEVPAGFARFPKDLPQESIFPVNWQSATCASHALRKCHEAGILPR